MKKTLSVLKWLLIVWGGVCAIGALVLGSLLAYSLGPGNRATIDSAHKRDVRFVLNWCRLGDNRIAEVVHSYESARSLTGDHLDAYAIRVTHVDPSELTKDNFGYGWSRCDQTEGILKDAVDFACGWLHKDALAWFPRADELRSSEMYVYPWSIYCCGTRPTAVKLIFVRPKDHMVFYMSTKV